MAGPLLAPAIATLLCYTLTSCLSAKRCARDRSPPRHHLQGIGGGSAEGSLAPVSPKKDAQPGQTGSDQVGWDMTEQVPGIGGRSEQTVSLLLPRSPVYIQHEPSSQFPVLGLVSPCPRAAETTLPLPAWSAQLVLTAKSSWWSEHCQQV